MKLDLKFILIIIIVIVSQYWYNSDEDPIKDVSVVTKEVSGKAEEVIVDVVHDTIYIDKIIPGKRLPAREKIVVDSLYKAKYEEAVKTNDTLKAKNLFLESIALDTYAGTLVDNNDIKIDGEFLTRGKLLEYDIKYKIKSDTITYTPKIVTKYPKFSLTGGIELGLPTNPLNNSSPLISAEIGFVNRKGKTLTFGFDSKSRFTVGYSIVLFKTKK